jgi:diguanylate cyclase (GGDEF)-like protein
MVQNRKTPLPVLILDDDIEVARALARDLRRHAQVEVATHPNKAFELLSTQSFSVILSDFKMPDMNGLEVLERCAKDYPLMQRILITAFVDLADIFSSINRAQLNHIMTKPWEAFELQSTIEAGIRTNEALRENTELRQIAWTDALTGVANHRYFWERLESEFSRAERFGRPLSLIIADVDDFKKFNDSYGHQKGDAVLREVAQCLDKNRRSMDTVARYGGEEFAIILPEVSRPKAVEIAKRLLAIIISSTQISLSLGVAAYPDDAHSSTELVNKADLAMYKAKAQGKSRVVDALELKTDK